MKKSSLVFSVVVACLLVVSQFAISTSGFVTSAYACSTWQVGQRVDLRGGSEIRHGSGLGYAVHTIVPEDHWQVDVIDGPRYADGYTWWDISRRNLDGGGTGWVYIEQAGIDVCSNNNNPPPLPAWFGQGCNTSYSGPGGLRAGGYDPTSLTQEQRQWLFEVFGNTGIAPVGFGGPTCPWQNQNQPPPPPAWFGQGCNTSYTGPGGLRAGGYDPTSLTQEQRQWLFEVFGNTGIAPVGFGGPTCPWQNQNQPPPPPAWFGQGCDTAYTGPGGLRAGGYDPTSLSQEQRQWLFEVFGNTGIAPVGFGGPTCPWQNQIQPTSPPMLPWFGQGCNTSYTGPGGLRAGGYDPTSLTQEQRQWLFEVFGNAGIAPVGFGGQTCDYQNQSDPSNAPKNGNPDGNCSAALSPKISVGTHVRVSYTDGSPNRLRSDASKTAFVIAEIPEGQEFDVIGGPVCNVGWRWWQVSTGSGTGWMADSGAGVYWIEPYASSNFGQDIPQPQSPQPSASDSVTGLNPDFSSEQVCEGSAQLKGYETYKVAELCKMVPSPNDVSTILKLVNLALDSSKCWKSIYEAFAVHGIPYLKYKIPVPQADFVDNCFPVSTDLVDIFNELGYQQPSEAPSVASANNAPNIFQQIWTWITSLFGN